MNTEEMFQEVDRRVADGIMEHLLPKAIHIHTIREWKNCDCSFCVTKRRATFDIAHCVYPKEFIRPTFNKLVCRALDSVTFEPIQRVADYEPWEIKDFLRKDLRKQYQNKLKELCNE